MEEYLTITELSVRLKVKPKTIKNKMASGIFRKGIHYFSPKGLGPRFRWSAVVAWLEQSQEPVTATESSPTIFRWLRQPSFREEYERLNRENRRLKPLTAIPKKEKPSGTFYCVRLENAGASCVAVEMDIQTIKFD